MGHNIRKYLIRGLMMKKNHLDKYFAKTFIGAACFSLLLSVMSCTTFGAVEDDFRDEGYDVINNSITVNSEGDVSEIGANKGLMSATSIYCVHNAKQTGEISENGQNGKPYYAAGSGVIYKLFEDGSAFILTNYHVIYDAKSKTKNGISDNISLFLYGMESSKYKIEAKYVGGSANYDVAVLYVNGSDVMRSAMKNGVIRSAEIGDEVCAGQKTLAIGNPSGSGVGGLSVTSGIVSVDSEYISMSKPDGSGNTKFRVIRTDTAINSGNSGGGLFDANGKLIGIINAKISGSTVENIGYAIPISVAKGVADNIIHNCHGKDNESVLRASLGISLEAQDSYALFDYNTSTLVKKEKVVIKELDRAYRINESFKKGDIIKYIEIDGNRREIGRIYHVVDKMLEANSGSTIIIQVSRGGQDIEISLTVDPKYLIKC